MQNNNGHTATNNLVMKDMFCTNEPITQNKVIHNCSGEIYFTYPNEIISNNLKLRIFSEKYDHKCLERNKN
uniref:Uncharacterized protein n=1 Tax=Setaria italica TaxID=4555 RepID=K3ZBH9_SETIT